MSLFVDKHRPKTLDNLHYHEELSKRIRTLATTAGGQDFPHLLFYGPSGAGKKTRINCTLRELYGPGADKLRIDQRVFKTPSNRKLDVNIVQSNYHIELTPSDVGNWDRSVVQDILKEIAQTQQIDLNAKKRFKVVVINEADGLSRDAQSALRRTMEKYSNNLRLILCANSTSKIIGPIRSRCLLLRVGAPTEEEICKVIAHVAKKERLTVPSHVQQLIASMCGGNLRRALLSFEALHVQDTTFSKVSKEEAEQQIAKGNKPDLIPRPDWEKYCSRVAERIMGEQSPDRLYEVRGMLYELLVHCIPPNVVISTIAKRLMDRMDEEIKPEVAKWAAHYDHRLKLGNKPIYHLEAFVAKIMYMQKCFIDGFMED